MKKLILNISDSTYEKLKFEAIIEKKDIKQLLSDKICNNFSYEVQQAFDNWLEKEIKKI